MSSRKSVSFCDGRHQSPRGIMEASEGCHLLVMVTVSSRSISDSTKIVRGAPISEVRLRREPLDMAISRANHMRLCKYHPFVRGLGKEELKKSQRAKSNQGSGSGSLIPPSPLPTGHHAFDPGHFLLSLSLQDPIPPSRLLSSSPRHHFETSTAVKPGGALTAWL